MKAPNHTIVTEFILPGLTENPTLHVILFMVFLGIYAVTLVTNFSIITLIRSCPQIHTPMYQFLSHLAFVDIGFSTSVTPIMLAGFLGYGMVLSVAACEAQFCIAVVFNTVECFLLAAMVYDRYVAICSPLLYSTHMSPRICFLLVGVSYVGGCLNPTTYTSCLLSLSFCGPNHIDQSVIVVTVFVIAVSYTYILITILKMRSPEGCHKAFSTCTSHLTAVTLYYGTLTFIYVIPKSSYSTDQNKIMAVFYTVVIPMLNPLIYSLRNRDVKEALRKDSIKIYTRV